MVYQSKRELQQVLLDLGEEAPNSWTRSELQIRIKEIRSEQGLATPIPGKRGTPFRQQVIAMNKAAKKKPDLQEFTRVQMALKVNGNETIAQLEKMCLQKIYETTPPSGEDPVGFGLHCSLSYSELLMEHPDYAAWVKTTAEEDQGGASYRLMRLANWLMSQPSTDMKVTYNKKPVKKSPKATSIASESSTKSKEELTMMVKNLQEEVNTLKSQNPQLPRKMAEKRDEEMSSNFSLVGQ